MSSSHDPAGPPQPTHRAGPPQPPHPPQPTPQAPNAPSTSGTEPRRTHPVTPLIAGWKVIVGVIAVLAAQNLAQLLDEFTVRRALLALAVLAGVLLISVAISALSWWRTRYQITPDGVVLSHGILTRSRRTAPQEKIETVSVERPALARALGLAKVRIEIAGGSDSHLDIEYVRTADAERIRTQVLRVARQDHGGSRGGAEDGAHTDSPSTGDPAAGGPGHLRSILHDGVTDGVLIAEIPTARLVRSLLRDVGFVLTVVSGTIWAVTATVLAVLDEGPGIGLLVTVVPLLLTIPRMVLSRIDAGWGFVSRLTERGLRMRRGLFSTRTDNLASGRVQDLTLAQPLLWRRPGWVSATVTVAGVESEEGDGPTSALPVGTREELERTLGHLLPPIMGDDGIPQGDLATALRLLQGPARRIEGLRTRVPAFWISRRTKVAVLLPGALAIRSGILTRRLTMVPRERIQGVRLSEGPLQRSLGCADVQVGIAGASRTLGDLPRDLAVGLARELAADAAHGRLYRERDSWPQPPLALAGVRGEAS